MRRTVSLRRPSGGTGAGTVALRSRDRSPDAAPAPRALSTGPVENRGGGVEHAGQGCAQVVDKTVEEARDPVLMWAVTCGFVFPPM